MFCDFRLAPDHVRGLFGNEWIGDAATQETIDLQAFLVNFEYFEGFVLLGDQRCCGCGTLLI